MGPQARPSQQMTANVAAARVVLDTVNAFAVDLAEFLTRPA